MVLLDMPILEFSCPIIYHVPPEQASSGPNNRELNIRSTIIFKIFLKNITNERNRKKTHKEREMFNLLNLEEEKGVW